MEKSVVKHLDQSGSHNSCSRQRRVRLLIILRISELLIDRDECLLVQALPRRPRRRRPPALPRLRQAGRRRRRTPKVSEEEAPPIASEERTGQGRGQGRGRRPAQVAGPGGVPEAPEDGDGKTVMRRKSNESLSSNYWRLLSASISLFKIILKSINFNYRL